MAGTAVVEFQPGATTPEELGQRVSKLGYPSRPREASEPAPSDSVERHHRIAAIGSLCVFAMSMVLGAPLMPLDSGLLAWIAMPFHGLLHHALPALWAIPRTVLGWTLLILHLPVLLVWGRHFFVQSWKAARNLAADMNTLVAAGTGSAFLLSLPSVLAPDLLAAHGLPAPLWFESVSGVIGFVSLGKWLEAQARTRAHRQISGLVSLIPDEARVVEEGTERHRPSATLLPGDLVRVLPGERVPVDGTLEGEAVFVDESHLTGEPIPRETLPGDALQAGSLATTTPLLVRVERAGDSTTVQRIAHLVEDAQASKAPLQRTADRIAEVFAPGVILFSAGTLVVRLLAGSGLGPSLEAAIAVLVAACPCAMGLAVPSALAVAVGRAARLGILVRDATALENLGKVDVVVFDKTGTLTEGRPRLARIEPAPGIAERDLLGTAAAVEAASAHPLAAGIAEAAHHWGILLPEVTECVTTPGMGVEGVVDGHRIRAGRLEWCSPSAKAVPSGAETAVHVSRDGMLLGAILFSDPLRPSAKETVQRLHRLGVKVELLSGDHVEAVRAVAEAVGANHWTAEATPESKAEHVAALRSKGLVVAMVGDGINDAAALAASDAGLAIESGSAVAFDCAAAVLRDPASATTAIELGRATIRTVIGNLVWAFGYNLLLLPVAAGCLIPFTGTRLSPVLAGAAMSLSSVSVMLNSLRLLSFRPRSRS